MRHRPKTISNELRQLRSTEAHEELPGMDLPEEVLRAVLHRVRRDFWLELPAEWSGKFYVENAEMLVPETSDS